MATKGKKVLQAASQDSVRKVYYEKVGRRYVPVSEYDEFYNDSLPMGNHLIVVQPYSTYRHFRIDPAYAPLVAAGLVAKQAISTAIAKADTVRPTRSPMTEAEQEAWENLISIWGESARSLTRNSYNDIAQAGVDALIEQSEKLLENEAVRKAYEHFILMCKLTSEEGVK